MGSLYAALLARSGEAVTVLDGWTEHIDAIGRDGLHLDGITGDMRIALGAATRAEECPPADLALVQVNAYSTPAAAAALRVLLKPDGVALTLQNGIGNVEALSALLGRERVLGGLSYHSAALQGPGHVTHTHAGPTWLGELDGTRGARVEGIAARFAAAGFDPIVVEDIVGYIWNKFIHNCAINAVAAITGLRVGEIAGTPAADELQTRIVEEALALVRAKGIRLPEPDPMAAIKAFCRLKYNKPSMLQHLERGRPTEIDALNGALVRESRAVGLEAPYNEAITLMIKARERFMEIKSQQPLDYDRLEAEAKATANVG
jgi:2-dehydropantoate 2-reductase